MGIVGKNGSINKMTRNPTAACSPRPGHSTIKDKIMITITELAKALVHNIEHQADIHGVTLIGIARDNFDYFLDDAFDNESGSWCIQLIENARWETFNVAFDMLENRYQ